MNANHVLWSAVLAANLTMAAAARAEIFLVTNALDSGAGSLRQAILNLNASGTDGSITFSGSYSITLASALPEITQAVQLDGAGSTVSGNSHFRCFTINAQSGAAVGLANLMVVNGSVHGAAGAAGSATGGSGGSLAAGAGIYVNSGVLTITQVSFAGHTVA